MKKLIKIFLLIIFVISLFNMMGCDSDCVKKERSDKHNATTYYKSLRVGSIFDTTKLPYIDVCLARQTYRNTVWRVDYYYYFTVDPNTNIIKSIWVQ